MMASVMKRILPTTLVKFNNNNNSNDDDDSGISSSYSSYYPSYSYSSFSLLSSATSTSTLSLSNIANEQLQEIPTRTNSMVRAKKAKIISSSSSLTAMSSTRQTLIVRPSIAMTLPMEIICEIFNYLEEHPAHFTRGSLVCKTWYYSTQNHLYWKRLCELLKLPSPKPRAYKYKTYKSIVIKNWGSFCSLCLRKRRKYDPPIKPMLVDMDIADRIDFKKSKWYIIIYKKKEKKEINNSDNSNVDNGGESNNNNNSNSNNNNNNNSNNNSNNGNGINSSSNSILKQEDDEEEDDENEEEEGIVNKPKLKHHLCTYCEAIYCRYQKDKAIKRRRKKIKSSLAKCGIQLPTNDDICERLIDDGNIKGILHYLKLKLEEEKEELFKALLELERNG